MFKRLFACAALLCLGAPPSSAAPIAGAPEAHLPIILVAGGCGPAFHRNPFGACVPNRRFFYGPGPVVERLPPPCPRGYHRDPDPARRLCYPNF